MRRMTTMLVLMLAMAAGSSAQRGPGSQGPPNISGAWVGTWSAYNPARPSTPPQEQCARLSATIAQKGNIWEAVFEGDCGRPYKYTITMEGRAVGPVVLFKGSVDLGAKDGGVYDWIGRAVETEFVGFYTSAAYTGVFNMTRAKP
jgi:hypothetical protein